MSRDGLRELRELRAENEHLRAENEHLRSRSRARAVSVKQAAEELGLAVKTIRRRIADGPLPASRVAGTNAIRINRADLAALLRPATTGGEQR